MYRAIGISKQAVLKMVGRKEREKVLFGNLILIIMQLRQEHPTIGVRTMYHMIKPDGMGRDRFEGFCRHYNLMSKVKRNYHRTTDSRGVTRFENLKEGMLVMRVNQLWQSDITYFELAGKFYYITFITDSCSRFIVGYSVSDSLLTEGTTLKAMKMAIRRRGERVVKESSLILHSDGGGQYYCKRFLTFLRRFDIRSSMCEYPWENGIAERVNGIIKNNYLIHRNIKSFKELCKEVARSVKLYNEKRPHTSLHKMTPVEYEKMLSLQEQKKTGVTDALDVS